MALYLIAYDLHTPGQKYQKLIERIKQICNNCWSKPLESTFIISHSGPADKIHKELNSLLDGNDSILVIKVDNADWQGWVDKDAAAWLNS